MKLEIHSDLHLEFDKNQGRKFMHHMDPEGTDVLILAGDITVQAHLPYVLRTICEKYAPRPVLFVCGNHEFYGSRREEVLVTLHLLGRNHGNLYFLQNKTVEINGLRFAGTTLWFPEDPLNFMQEDRLNDFTRIRDFREWVYEENAAAQNFLVGACSQPVDVVITHHAPSSASMDPKHKGDPFNRFYYTEMSHALLGDKAPALWVHGHVHHPMDYVIHKTRIYSNPRGYQGYQLVQGYRGKHLLDIQPREA